MPGMDEPSSEARVTDCQNCPSASSCTAFRRSEEMTAVLVPKVDESCGATVDESWPGTLNTATILLEEAAEIYVRADSSSVCTCTRSAASEESRIPCAALVARLESTSTWLSLDWNRSFPTLTDM